jgi:hypothetical protein
MSLGVVPAHAADSSVSLYFSNTYIFRGINFNDSGVMQVSIDTGSIQLGKNTALSFNAWANMDIGTDVGDNEDVLSSGDYQEVDLIATLALPKGFKLGYIEYLFPAGVIGTRELFVGWSKDMTVSPEITFYYDVDEVEDFYATVALGYSIPLSESASFDLGGLVGLAGEDFAASYSGGTEGGLYNYDVNAGISFAASEKVSLGAVVGIGDTLNENALPDALTQGFYAGASISVSF